MVQDSNGDVQQGSSAATYAISFGSWLKSRRKESGLSAEDLAEQIGCSSIALRKIESGERRPSRQIALLLADYFDIRSDEREAFTTFARQVPSVPQTGRSVLGTRHSVLSAPWRTAHSHKTNLPAVLTSLIGREAESATLRGLLAQPQPRVRLLTLTGPPGVGKTRLALDVASGLVDHYDDGVFYVELAPLADPELVIPAIARTFDLRESSDQTAAEALAQHLRDKQMLLVLDNFEQILDAGPSVVSLMQQSPWLKVLVTSREALHVRGERPYPVPPLPVPSLPTPELTPSRHSDADQQGNGGVDIRTLTSNPAVELFVERAQEARAEFALDPQNAKDVAVICVDLEGLPLAIELAAARADLLAPADIRTALGQRLEVLSEGARDLPARQRSLRSAISWSYDLLAEEEQTLFARLGVFVGGFTLEAADSVGVGVSIPAPTPNPQALTPTLGSLVGKSLLLRAQGNNGEPRYRMLETVREYALLELEAREEEEFEARRRHAEYYLALAEAATANKTGPDQGTWLDRLQVDHDNLRAALRWLLDRGLGDPELTEMALRLGYGLYSFWDARGHFTEGRAWLTRILENAQTLASGETTQFRSLRSRLMNTAGLMAWNQGDHPEARRLYEAALPIKRELGERRAVSSVLNNLAILAMERGDYQAARELYVESLQMARGEDKWLSGLVLNNLGLVCWEMGDVASAEGYYEESALLFREIEDRADLVLPLDNLGILATNQGDYAAAQRYQQECLALCRELDHKNSLAHVLANMGFTAAEMGDYDAARRLYLEGLPMSQELGYRRVVLKYLEGIADMSARLSRPLDAARLWGAAAGMRDAVKLAVAVPARARYEGRIASAREATGDEAFKSAWDQGRSLPVEQAVAAALAELRSGLEARV
jgi:predicted ATPase/transcriptional regulator with XRE-family HTH domain